VAEQLTLALSPAVQEAAFVVVFACDLEQAFAMEQSTVEGALVFAEIPIDFALVEGFVSVLEAVGVGT